MIILVDWENIGCNLKSLNGIEYLDKNDTVEIFYSASRPMIKQEELNKLLESNCNLKLTKLLTVRSNALDFYICCAAGIYLSQHNFENVNIGILSGDTGFDSLIEYINSLPNCNKVKVTRDTVIAQIIRHFNEASKQKAIIHINNLNKSIEIEKAYTQYLAKQKQAEKQAEEQTEEQAEEENTVDTFIDLDELDEDTWIYGGDDFDYENNLEDKKDNFPDLDDDEDDFNMFGLIEDEEEVDYGEGYFTLSLGPFGVSLGPEEVDKVFNSIFKTTQTPAQTSETAEISKTTETSLTKLIDKLPNYNLSQKEHEILNSYLEITPYTTLQKLYHDIISLYGRNRGLVIYKALKEDLKAIKDEEKTSGKTESK